MAEASDNLKKLITAHPEISKLASQKSAMRQALIGKCYSEDLYGDKLDNMMEYAELIANLNFSIDSAIRENNYTHEFGDQGSLSTMLSNLINHHEQFINITEYKAGDFDSDSTLMYLAPKPLAAGSLEKFCYNTNSLCYIPQLDYSQVTTLKNTMNFTPSKYMYWHDVYEVDLSSLTYWYEGAFFPGRTIILKNMPGKGLSDATTIFGKMVGVERLIGVNISQFGTQGINTWGNGKTRTLKHIEFADGSYIQYANIMVDGLKVGIPDVLTEFDQFDAETLYNMCKHAYDWVKNEKGLKKFVNIPYKVGGSSGIVNYLDYHFSADAKSKLEGAYPGIDFKQMMEDKGWNY